MDILEHIHIPEESCILDVCAAPGGKTSFMADHWPKAAITALDIDEERIQIMRKNLERTRISMPILCADATNTQKILKNKEFDLIIVDAPCSATGVISKHPEIKLHRTENSLQNLAETQLSILHELWPKLKKGASLVYLVCSILPEEGLDIIKKLNKNINFSIEFKKTYLPSTYYHGFFGCILKKIN